MRRRAFLASALIAASTAAAGCGFVESPTERDEPAVVTNDDPTLVTNDDPQDTEKYLEFRNDGAELATLGVDPEGTPSPSDFRTSISHTEDTELQTLTQRFVAQDGDGTPPKLSLQGPFMGDHEPHPSVSLYQEGKAAVVEVHRFGELADESVFIGLPVTSWPESARQLVVENAVELVQTGTPDQPHVLEGQLEFEFGEPETDSQSTEAN
jgi:hypothetical protein